MDSSIHLPVLYTFPLPLFYLSLVLPLHASFLLGVLLPASPFFNLLGSPRYLLPPTFCMTGADLLNGG